MSATPAEGRLGSLKSAIQTLLFGYDFFISYRHADGAAYATSLYQALRRRGFDCFLDNEHYEAGNSLPAMQSRALKRSSKLVVVVSPLAHRAPAGTDWLIAEVTEFKHLAAGSGVKGRIVPVGTRATLDPRCFAESALLPQIPSPSTEDICIFDDAVESDREAAASTVDKLARDFGHRRRRTLRLWASGLALATIASALAFGIFSAIDERAARTLANQREAFRLLDRAREALEGKEDVKEAGASLDRAEKLLVDLGYDPLMLQHYRFAVRLKSLRAEAIASVDREPDRLILSADGKWMLVIHDYQAPGGDPDPERIPDWTAFGVLDLQERKWTLRQPIKSAIGKEIYQSRDVVAFLPPDHVVVRSEGQVGAPPFAKVSLQDGKREGIGWVMPPEPVPTAAKPTEKTRAEKRLESLMSEERLYTIPPRDGIDMQYGARLVSQTYVTSPDGRTALLGTYEGRLILVDVATGLRRGEISTAPIYAAAYRHDGAKGYASDGSAIWEIDTSGWRGASEFRAPLRGMDAKHTFPEKVLGASLSDDASMLAMATTERLLARRVPDGKWMEWPMPRAIEGVAALRVDGSRQRIEFVIADDGMIGSVDYRSPNTPLQVVPRPGGPEPTVAWLDEQEPMAWLAPRKPGSPGKASAASTAPAAAYIRGVPLPGAGAAQAEVALPPLRGESPDDALAIHAIAKLGQTLLVFHGSEEDSDDRRGTVRDEQMLRMPLGRTGQVSSRVIFETTTGRNGPDYLSSVTQIQSVLPGSTADNLLLRSSYGNVHAVDKDGRPRKLAGVLAARGRSDRKESYEVRIRTLETDVWVAIRHDGTNSTLEYQLPWSYKNLPIFASITPSGRQALIATHDGECLVVDVSAK